MKICFLSHSAIHPRQRWFYEEFAKLEDEVLVLSPYDWGNQRLVAYEKENFQCKTHKVTNQGNLFSYTFPEEAFTDLEKFNPDIIHCQNELRCAQTKLAREWAFKLACRFSVFVFENIYSPTEADEKVIAGTSLIIAGNNDARELIAKFFPTKLTYGHKKVVVLPQAGINLDSFKPMDTGKQFHLGYAGRLVPEKGIDLIRKIEAELKIDVNWIIGKEYSKVAEELNRCLVFIYPPFQTSTWKEQCGYAPLEAMACGVPVVATKCGSLEEYLGDAALLTQQHDYNQLEYLVEFLLKDENLRNIQREKGLNRIQSFYSNEVVAKAYLDLFRELVEGN